MSDNRVSSIMRSRKIKAFILFSFVSFFADFTYEGARSVSGPILDKLGASLIIAGTLSLGEAVSYFIRLLSGVISFRYASPRMYWFLVFSGYVINLGAVPLLAITHSWELAYLLYIIERAGKGLRVPPRDAILAELGSEIGVGKLYGIHELLDQAGAVLGALFVGLSASNSLYISLELLSIPAAIAILLLVVVYFMYPSPRSAEKLYENLSKILFRLATPSLILAFSVALFVHWSTASYILSLSLSAEKIAMLYSLAMLSDGLIALPLGFLYDRVGKHSVLLLPVLSIIATISLFKTSPVIFTILWGTAISGYETIAKAYIAETVEARARGFAFGLVYSIIGLGWTLGNVLLVILIT